MSVFWWASMLDHRPIHVVVQWESGCHLMLLFKVCCTGHWPLATAATIQDEDAGHFTTTWCLFGNSLAKHLNETSCNLFIDSITFIISFDHCHTLSFGHSVIPPSNQFAITFTNKLHYLATQQHNIEWNKIKENPSIQLLSTSYNKCICKCIFYLAFILFLILMLMLMLYVVYDNKKIFIFLSLL